MDTNVLICGLLCALFVNIESFVSDGKDQKTRLKVQSCMNPPVSDIFNMTTYRAMPFPITIPGSVQVALGGNLKVPITSDLNLDIHISRQNGWLFKDVPCVNTSMGQIGSCEYKNICSLAAKMFANGCPRIMTRNGLPCTCPIQAGSYSLQEITFNIPDIKNHPSLGPVVKMFTALFDLTGDYVATIRLRDVTTKELISCTEAEVSLTEPKKSQGLFKDLGRFLTNLWG